MLGIYIAADSMDRFGRDKMTLTSNNEHKEISWPAAVVLLTAGLAVLLCTAQAHANNDSIRALIQLAGNTNSDLISSSRRSNAG